MTKKRWLFPDLKKNYQLYLLSLPVFVYFIVFHYGPMYGIQLAFKRFVGRAGIWGSPWVGLENFTRFFNSFHFWTLLGNTLRISVYSLVAGFPIPILLALILNELPWKRMKKTVQLVTYAPHFISTVVMAGMIIIFLQRDSGIVNHLLSFLGLERIAFMNQPSMFDDVYVWTGVWQSAGWGSIIYISALSSIPPEYHEAARIDGASRLQSIWHINIPCLLPTATILLIMNTGNIMSVGFEKVYLLQNAMNTSASEVISTYVYKVGMIDADYSFSTAVGLFNSVINCILLVTVNQVAKKLGETSLF